MKVLMTTPRMMGMGLLLLLIGTVIWATPGSLVLQSLSESPRTGSDPLSQAEQEMVLLEVRRQAPAMNRQLRQARRSELLLVERHQESKEAIRRGVSVRRADTFIYLYDTDTLLHAVVNLEKRAVESLETVRGVQLPLTQNETAQAKKMVLEDAKVGRAIREEYQSMTREALKSPEKELQVRALIFTANGQPNVARGAAAKCGQQRCAQLLLSTQDDVVINLLPIINLSTGQVVFNKFFQEESEEHSDGPAPTATPDKNQSYLPTIMR
jgi:hypothetical protein